MLPEYHSNSAPVNASNLNLLDRPVKDNLSDIFGQT